jgi:hypothetical protein
MRLRWIIYGVYLTLIIAGSFRQLIINTGATPATTCSTSTTWLAAKDLPPNTRISQILLKQPDLRTPADQVRLSDISTLEGKYALSKIKKDCDVTEKQLGKRPVLTQSGTDVLLFYEAQQVGAVPDQLNATAQVYVCEAGNTCQEDPFQVETVFGKDKIETFVIRASAVAAKRLMKIVKPQFHIAALP